ncbi:classical arabinogalactan protein 7-like [Leptopilina heterotoma]|uniref:classical arabinogalactan protein 7-like n=1 Tax=Leptopilina heterotoma TaxID=63436 RepID=UPI001CAA0203|nr:classical arabinogalactan protein 7-like [Leptopilina heterotoma]
MRGYTFVFMIFAAVFVLLSSVVSQPTEIPEPTPTPPPGPTPGPTPTPPQGPTPGPGCVFIIHLNIYICH